MRPDPRFICKHCSAEDCYEHCQKTEDGKHKIDPYSATTSVEDGGVLVNVNCGHCGASGSAILRSSDVLW
jgi:hypothetical protein